MRVRGKHQVQASLIIAEALRVESLLSSQIYGQECCSAQHAFIGYSRNARGLVLPRLLQSGIMAGRLVTCASQAGSHVVLLDGTSVDGVDGGMEHIVVEVGQRADCVEE